MLLKKVPQSKLRRYLPLFLVIKKTCPRQILQERVLEEASHLLMDLTMVVTIERNVAGKVDLVRHTLTLEALASLRKSGKGP